MDNAELCEITDRLTEFAAKVGDTAPAAIMAPDGALSDEMKSFRKRHNLTLDWIITGEGAKYRRGDGTAAAYHVLNMLRVCVRSLDGDMPDLPGDETATAQTLEVASRLMGDVIDALEAAEARKRPTPGQSGIVALCARLEAVSEQQIALVAANAGNDPDTPASAELDAQEEALCKQIAGTRPESDADAAALLDWAVMDSCDGAIISELQVQAYKAVSAYLRRQW